MSTTFEAPAIRSGRNTNSRNPSQIPVTKTSTTSPPKASTNCPHPLNSSSKKKPPPSAAARARTSSTTPAPATSPKLRSGRARALSNGIRSTEPGDSVKLRVNRNLNSGGHMGWKMGNNLGVLGLMFAGIESMFIHCGTGTVYIASRGPRSAAVAGAIGGLAEAAVVGGKQVVRRYVPI